MEYKKQGAPMATTSPFPTPGATASSSNNACQVRVGVRIRPLTGQEAGKGGNSVLAVQQQQQQHGRKEQQDIHLGQRRFTHDGIFDANVSQQDLCQYQSVSAPHLISFIDGYNATVRNMRL